MLVSLEGVIGELLANGCNALAWVGGWTVRTHSRGLLIERIAERLAGLERRRRGGGDGDALPGRGVAALARRPTPGGKGPEARDRDLFAARQCLRDGGEYRTPDGTCMRDYIHVSDVAAIHVAALRGLENGAPDRVLNCGSGRGVSVREALAAVRAESGVVFAVRDGPRRAADPPGPGRRYRAAVQRAAMVAASWRPSRHRAQRARLGRSRCRRGPWTASRGQCLSPGTGCSTRRVSAWPRPARHRPGFARRGAGTSPRVSSAIWSCC